MRTRTREQEYGLHLCNFKDHGGCNINVNSNNNKPKALCNAHYGLLSSLGLNFWIEDEGNKTENKEEEEKEDEEENCGL